MRKELMSVLLMSQMLGSFAMNGSIVSLDAVNAEAQRFQQSVNMAVREVQAGRSTTDNAIAIVGGTYQNQLSTLRTQINQRFFDQVRDQELQQEQQTQNLINSRQREISVLQARLSETSGNNGNLYPLPGIGGRLPKPTGAPELVTDRQIDRTIERFMKQLDKIKDQIQSGQKTLEEAFERTQERYGDSIESLIGELQDRYEDIVANLNSQHEDERSRLEEAYEQQKAVLERMLAEAEGLNGKLEKEKQLHSYVSRIFVANPSLEPKKILVRATDIERIMDVSKRHATMDELCKKFNLFYELYGNTKLGVVATKDDFNSVSQYVEDTYVGPKPPKNPPKLIGNIIRSAWRSGRVSGKGPCIWREDASFLQNKYGIKLRLLLDRNGRMYAFSLFGISKNMAEYNHFKEIENEERMRIYNKAKSRYAMELERSKNAIFPTESFNRLVDQFNEFVNRL